MILIKSLLKLELSEVCHRFHLLIREWTASLRHDLHGELTREDGIYCLNGKP